MKNYRATTTACYIGNFVQAAVVNLMPLLFIPLREQYGLSYTQLGALILVNFLTQVASDFICARAIDKTGFRAMVVWAHALCFVGFLLFALAPFMFGAHVYAGLLFATMVMAAAGGMLEVLLTPIVHAIPAPGKETAIALLHSFYAWGQMAVILLTTALLFVLERTQWQWIVLCWSVVPLLNFLLFCVVPLPPKPPAEDVMRFDHLLRNPIFLLAFLAILFGAASEVTMNQWISAYLEKGVGLSKTAGDLLGMCVFAATLGVGRFIYGLYGARLKLDTLLPLGCVGAVACYVAAVFSPPALAAAACGVSGFFVSLMWPGTLVSAANRLPAAGASLFALMACGGDIGAAVGPWLAGVASDVIQNVPAMAALAAQSGQTAEQLALRGGLLLGALFPLLALACHLRLRRK